MTGPITTGLTGPTATKFSPGTGSTQLWNEIAATPSITRMGVNGRTAKPTGAAGKPAGTTDVKRVTQASPVQIKAFAATFVSDCWKSYATKYPEAFRSGTGLSKTKAPKLVFLSTEAEFVKAFAQNAGEQNAGEIVAFVKSNEPGLICVYTPNLVKYANTRDGSLLKSVLSHELIHSLTIPLFLRIQNDRQLGGTSKTYGGVTEDLKLYFDFGRTRSKGALSGFTVRELITEFAADHYSTKATGLKYFGVAYAQIRSTGDKLVRIVGEDVFRKAVLANDPVAYKKVVKAAAGLQAQNEKEVTVADRAERVTKMRTAQTATPFGTPISTKTLDKLQDRYFSESDVQETLDQYSPTEAKNFDFRFSNAVNAYFKSRGVAYDRYSDKFDENARNLSAAISAVWPTLK